MNKIIVNDKVISEILSTSKTADQVLSEMYEGEIADRINSNEKFKEMTPLKMAMYDCGIDKNSTIKDFTTQGASEYLLPVFIDSRMRESVASSSILSYLHGGNTVGVDSLTVMAAHLDLVKDEKNKKNISKVRVAEGADIPLAEIGLGESSIRLFKYGRAVQATYEALQYMRVDLFSKTLDAIANDVADQESQKAIEVLVYGDGNDNAAEAIETTTAGTVTEDDVLNAVIEFQINSKLPVTTIVATRKFYTQMYKMLYSTDQAFGVAGKLGFEAPQFGFNRIQLILDTRVPMANGKEQAILLNKDYALVKYFANGSNIREMQTNIRNQTRLGTISEISAFAKFNNDATLLLRSK